MSEHSRLDHDWYDGVLPPNVLIHPSAFIETTFGLTRFESTRRPALVMGEASGLYSTTLLDVGRDGRVSIGPYSCLNASYVVCNREVDIGSHCLISWGVVITDTDIGPGISEQEHSNALRGVPKHASRQLRPLAPPRPVVIEDGVWLGFGSVIMPGVRLGRGCIVGSKTVVDRDVPPLAVVVGNPCRIVRYLDPDDVDANRDASLSALGLDRVG